MYLNIALRVNADIFGDRRTEYWALAQDSQRVRLWSVDCLKQSAMRTFIAKTLAFQAILTTPREHISDSIFLNFNSLNVIDFMLIKTPA